MLHPSGKPVLMAVYSADRLGVQVFWKEPGKGDSHRAPLLKEYLSSKKILKERRHSSERKDRDPGNN